MSPNFPKIKSFFAAILKQGRLKDDVEEKFYLKSPQSQCII